MKNIFKMAAIIALAITFFTGCSYPEDTVVGSNSSDSNGNSSGGSGGNSSSGSGNSNSSKSYIFQDFSGSGTPTGWNLNRFSWNSSGGVDGSECLKANIYGSNETASITTSSIAIGANPVLSFKYKATTGYDGQIAATNVLQYTVFVSTDDGSTWTALNGFTDIRHVYSADFSRIHVDLSSYAKQTIKIRITFARLSGDIYVSLDEIAIGTVPSIFSGKTTLEAGVVYNNYSSPLAINERTYRISNKGASPLAISGLSTTNGITVVDLPTSLDAFDTITVTVAINASSFGPYSAYKGSFTFKTNDAEQPTITVNVTGDVIHAPDGNNQDFSGSGTPTGWTLNKFSWNSNGGVEGSACLRANIYSSNTTASIITSNAATKASSVLSFKYKATKGYDGSQAAVDDVLQYTVLISTDNGNTWAALEDFTDVLHVYSEDYDTIAVELPDLYANQIIREKIIFTRLNDDIYVWLDDIILK